VRLLPELMKARKATRTLRIWSAACSSGEALYTLAIQIYRSVGVGLSDWRIASWARISARTGKWA